MKKRFVRSRWKPKNADEQLPGLERDARDAIAVRIAQPVQAMLRLDQQLIALDPRARVIGRPQPDQLRAQQRRSRIVVAAAMLDDDAHAAFSHLPAPRGDAR